VGVCAGWVEPLQPVSTNKDNRVINRYRWKYFLIENIFYHFLVNIFPSKKAAAGQAHPRNLSITHHTMDM